jgi:hypothetical protein
VGETLLERGLFHEDLFSHTMPGERFVPYEWLSEVLFALAHRVGGLPGVVIFTGLIVAASFALVALFLRRRGADPLLALVTAMAGALISAFHWLARPHIFTFLGTMLLLWLLESRAPRWKALALALMLFAGWANLHGGFLFGLVLAGIYIAGDAMEWLVGRDRAFLMRAREHALLLGAAIGGAAINPTGFALFAHVTGYLGKTYLVNVTNEYMSPDFHLFFGRAFLIVIMTVVVALAHNRRRMPWPALMVLLGTLAFALHSARNIPLFALTALPLVALHFDSEWRLLTWRPMARLRAAVALGDGQARAGGWSAVTALLFGVLAAGSGRLAGVPVVRGDFDPATFPVEAVRKAREANLEGRIFNYFTWGGYLLYAWPEQRVFIDGQTDFYGEALTREYGDILAVREGWRERLDSRRIEVVLMPAGSALERALSATTGWRQWERDSTAVVLVRDPD